MYLCLDLTQKIPTKNNYDFQLGFKTLFAESYLTSSSSFLAVD